MQLGDLVKPIEDMTDDELRERLQGVRQRQSVERPAAKARAAKKEKKETRKRLTPIQKLLEGLSEEEIQALLEGMQ